MSTAPDGAAPVDGGTIAAAAAIDDVVARNRAVTATYAALARGMRGVVGPDDATWCAFAVWASATAGRSIAMEEFPAAVEDELTVSPTYHEARTRLGEWLQHSDVVDLIDQAALSVRAAVSGGNTLVFQELAPLFAGLVTGTAPAGPPPVPAVAEAGGHYADARAATDGRTRAQLVLLGNLVAVLHEQQRLQAPIATALDAIPVDAVHDRIRTRGGPLLPHPAAIALAAEMRRIWEEAMTEHLMTLIVAGEVLHLGRDVPAPAGGPLFPDLLDPPFPPALAAFLGQWDTTGLTGAPSGARDWRDLGQRMTYILNLFRSRQRQPSLFDAPTDPAVGPAPATVVLDGSDRAVAAAAAGAAPAPPPG
jgi:hypothetical protein